MRPHDPMCTDCDHDCPWRRTNPAPMGAPFCPICDDHAESAVQTLAATDVRCIATSPGTYAVQVRDDSLIVGYIRKLDSSGRRWRARASHWRADEWTDTRARADAVGMLVAAFNSLATR